MKVVRVEQRCPVVSAAGGTARWLAINAQRHGVPREGAYLWIGIAALVESLLC